MRPWDKHLDSDELDQLVWAQSASVAVAGPLSEQDLEEAQRHIDACELCSRKVQLHKSVQNEVSGMASPRNLPPAANCSDYPEWLRVAAGLVAGEEAKERVAHAAECGHCGPLLHQATDVLSDEATPNEEEVLTTLISAQAEQQEQLAARLRGDLRNSQLPKSASSWWSGFWVSWRPAVAVAAFALIAIAVWLGWSRNDPSSAERLLAKAYTEKRPFDARIPGADWAPIRAERNGQHSNFDQPSALFSAEEKIRDHWKKHSPDPAWLQAKARVELLDGNYSGAIDLLLQAQQAKPNSPDVLRDLGTAYYLSGTAENLSRAVELLQQARREAPKDPVILFNLGLACQKTYAYDCAIGAWQQYLQLDSGSEWSKEAQEKLSEVEREKQKREQNLLRPLLPPETIASDPPSPALQGELDGKIEEYLKQAVTDWLPAGFAARPQSHEALAASVTLSQILRERHGDSWLADLLGRPSGVQFPAAVQALASAVKADRDGDYAAAHDAAQSAAQLFRAADNPAGEARAQGEEAYADQLLWEGQRCLALVNSVQRQMQGRDWSWLSGHMHMEESNCANQVGDLETYKTALSLGVSEADAHHYPALYLRGVGFQSLAAASMGDSETAFALAAKGLQRFWGGEGTLMNGYNLYANLDPAADNLHLTNFQVVLWQEAVGLIDHHPDILQRAMAHRWYGKAAYQANMPALAAAEFAKAGALFKRCPPTIATTRDYMDAEVWLANAEIRRGDLDKATSTLQDIKPLLDSTPSFDPEIGFYSAQAEIALQRGDAAASESAVRSAVFLATWALRSLSSEADRHQWAQQTRAAYADAVEWKLRQGDARAALELWEWYRGAEFGAAEDHSSPRLVNAGLTVPPDGRDAPPLPSPTEVSQHLPMLRAETVVVYAHLPQGVAVWTYDDRGVSSRWLRTPPPALETMVTQFAQLCADRKSDMTVLRQAGAALYSALIAPLQDQLLPGRTLMFEPDEFLAAVPWPALVDNGGHYLAEEFPVVVSPGLYRSVHLRRAVPMSAQMPALVVSVAVVPEGRLLALPDADREAEGVKEKLPYAMWLRGEDATLSGMRHEMRGAAVFHFAGHAEGLADHSGLLLAERDPKSGGPRVVDGQSFTPAEAEHLQLAVLSACNTGAEAQPGESGTESLADAFLHAGVPHVIVSRWNIDSSKTADYMKQFYAKLLAGDDAARAMQSAELALASQAESAHPYYWAAFEVEGNK